MHGLHRPWRFALAFTFVAAAVAFGACKKASDPVTNEASCATSADCPAGQVCGFANLAGDRSCAARGECVAPLDPQPTMLCGCDGGAVSLVVNDVDAGVFYWSGVTIGEQGFPPCGDAAVAPSSNAPSDAASASPDAGVDAAGPAPDGAADAPADSPSDAPFEAHDS